MNNVFDSVNRLVTVSTILTDSLEKFDSEEICIADLREIIKGANAVSAIENVTFKMMEVKIPYFGTELSEESKEIVDLLEQSESSLRTGEIAESIGKSKQAVSNILRRLESNGKISRESRGIYTSRKMTSHPGEGE